MITHDAAGSTTRALVVQQEGANCNASSSRVDGNITLPATPRATRVITPLPKSSAKIPSLGGLRGVSILMVIFSHLIGTRYFPVERSPALGGLGGLGVRVFFVISGLLITQLLLQGVQGQGQSVYGRFISAGVVGYSLRRMEFYWSRLSWLSWAGSTRCQGDVLHAWTYTMNYHHPHGYVGQEFHLSADALATGCLLSLKREWLARHAWYIRLLQSRALLLGPLLLVGMSGLHNHPRFLFVAGYSIMELTIAVLIDRWTRFPNRFLNSAALCSIGVLSYSLYLWQQLFLNRHATGPLNSFPLNLACTFVAAFLSYRLIEQPFLRLKDRIAGRWTRNGLLCLLGLHDWPETHKRERQCRRCDATEPTPFCFLAHDWNGNAADPISRCRRCPAERAQDGS